jgi:1-acyl-sn-glycerol-3-phosphate acyltransferase
LRRRTDPGFSPLAAATWRSLWPIADTLFKRWFPMERRGGSTPEGPIVVAANHFSHLDPVLVAIAIRHPVRFLAVDELFGRSRFFDELTQFLGAIPMTRTKVPFGPLKTALAELAAGGSIGLFPEGVRVWHWGERRAKRGAAWLAWHAGVPLVPVAIAGSDQAMGRGTARISRAPMTVEICPPVLPETHAEAPDPVGSMTEAWFERIDAALRSG